MAILNDMFSDATSASERAERAEAFKSAMMNSITEARAGRTRVVEKEGTKVLVKASRSAGRNAEVLDRLASKLDKSLSADEAAALVNDIASMRAEITKDWTPTSPIDTFSGATTGVGLTPYDLEGPAKELVPFYTPLRNSTPRTKGVGTAKQYRRITSVSNDGIPNGAGQLLPFFNSLSTTTSFGVSGGIALNRPQKINYEGDALAVAYKELGLSDSVGYLTQFEALGFDDPKALSHTALLYAHMMGEERADIFGRGQTSDGYSGPVSTSGLSPSATLVSGSLTGTYYVFVTAVNGQGETAKVAISGNTVAPSSQNIVVAWNNIPGAFAYNVYVGTSATTAYLAKANVVGKTVTVSSVPGSGTVAPTSDSSYSGLSYDGYLTVLSSSASGYFKDLGGAALTGSPAGAELDTALQTMYVNNGADPEELWMDAGTRVALNELIRNAPAGTGGYRVNLNAGDRGTTLGTVVDGFLNGMTGSVLSLNTHRFFPAGVIMIRSTSINTPNNHIPAPAAKVNVQDYMAIDWPQIQLSWDTSTYQVGTLVHYAPAWSGLICGINGG